MPNILINLAETQEHTYARYSYVLCSVMQCVNETHLHEVCQAVLIDRHVVCIKHIAVDQPYSCSSLEICESRTCISAISAMRMTAISAISMAKSIAISAMRMTRYTSDHHFYSNSYISDAHDRCLVQICDMTTTSY